MNKRPTIELPVRFSDCDPFGHLYSVRYLDLMFDGREQHVQENYPVLWKELQSRQRNWVVMSTEIRYLQPAQLGERVLVESSVFHVSRHGVMLEIAMLGSAGARPKALLWSKLQYVELQRGAIVFHSPEIQTFLADVQIEMEQRDLDERIKALSVRSWRAGR